MCNNFRRAATGFTLIEMIVAIVIISVGLAGVLMAFNVNVRSSADPMLRKQMLAVAEEMMEEILLKPFTISGVAPTNALVACGVAGAARVGFNDVRDYAGYSTTGICDIDGATVAGLANYNVSVLIANPALPADFGGLPVADVLRVAVTVTLNAETLTLVGWRTNYAI